MTSSRLFLSFSLALAVVLTPACQSRSRMPHSTLSAGALTVFDATPDAFSQPLPGLSEARRQTFFVGNSFFNQNWVSAPASVDSRDGLGPLFNARSCSGCHFKDGRSRPPDSGQVLSTMLLRVSSAQAQGPYGEPLPDPTYGDQIQGSAVEGARPEADVIVDYVEEPGRFADGEVFSLRRPRYKLERLAYGEPAAPLAISPRVAPAMIGLGLLEAVPESALRALSDPNDADGDGISGRVNVVHDLATGGTSIGRFGWKAEQPSVKQQVAAAFSGDMGLTSSLFPGENVTAAQLALHGFPSGGTPEVSDDILERVVTYARLLAVPARREHEAADVSAGEELFAKIGCASCHVPGLHTVAVPGLDELLATEIHPYTDLLLHDLGEGLSDGRASFAANGREWRTPPLWGIGLLKRVNQHQLLLHDGRARGFAEAILWHGGEAEASRAAFTLLLRAERAALLKFLESL